MLAAALPNRPILTGMHQLLRSIREYSRTRSAVAFCTCVANWKVLPIMVVIPDAIAVSNFAVTIK